MPIMADPYLASHVAKYFPLAGYKTFLIMFNCLPIFIIGTISCFLTRFRIGTITKKSVDSFLIGRVFSLIGKGLLIFGAFIFIAKHIDAKSAWETAKVFTLWKETGATELIYRVIWNLKPVLIRSAFEVIAIFGVAAMIPFCVTWALSMYRENKKRKEEKFWND
jgi:hypothetical protein